MEEEDLNYVQDYSLIFGISDIDFINEAIKEKIERIEKSKKNGTPFCN